jgi:predicted RNase H-like HicB family nuclease
MLVSHEPNEPPLIVWDKSNLDEKPVLPYLHIMASLEQGKLKEEGMKTYIFRIVLEKDRWPDEPESAAVWRAHIPILEAQGASTWGATKEEALRNIHEVLGMILEEFIEEGRPIPTGPESEIKVLDEPAISIAI